MASCRRTSPTASGQQSRTNPQGGGVSFRKASCGVTDPHRDIRQTPARPWQRAQRCAQHSDGPTCSAHCPEHRRSERERPRVRREVRKGGWVRTGESGVGLSEGRKGGLLHGQLVELGQLLG